MNVRVRTLALLTALALLASLVLGACGAPPSSEGTQDTSPSVASGEGEERVTLKMFMSDSGLPHPAGIDPSDNDFLGIVEDYANVDLEIEIPAITDFATRFTLMLSSGNLPDIVHTSICPEADEAAANGAFIDLKDYYDSSVNLKKWITPEMMEMASHEGGHYRVPMSGAEEPQGYYTYIRYELIQKYNDGVIPETVEDWVTLLKKQKAENPDAVPMAGYVAGSRMFYQASSFFQWYGARQNEFRVQDGQVISTFITPEYREVVQVYKDLYDSGVLDNEFATCDYATKWDKYYNQETMLCEDAASQILPLAAYWKTTEPYTEMICTYAKPLSEYPEVVSDPKYTYGKMSAPIIYHGLYISSDCEAPDRAWRVVEGFASDELYDMLFWGREGEEYEVVNGVRMPDAEKLLAPERYWSLHLALIFGFSAGQESKQAQQRQTLGDEMFELAIESVQAIEEQAEIAGVSLFSFMPEIPAVTAKLVESENFISRVSAQYIMGQISLEQFDAQVEEYKSLYGFIGEEYTAYMNAHKDDLRNWGVKEVDW